MANRRLVPSLLWMVGCLCGALVEAEDWPQWQGPQRDSMWRETGIVQQLPEQGPPVVWRAELGGGYTGPAVADGRVFVMDYQTDDQFTPSPNDRSKLQGQERVLCLSAANGDVLWEHQYDCPYEISYPAGPRATPTVDGQRVYTLGAEGNLYCLNVKDGSEVWSKQLKKEYDVETPIWGFCGHPLVDGDKLICLVGGEGSIAVAFNKNTGEEIWRSLEGSDPGYSPPTIVQLGGKRQLIIWHAKSVNSLDPETGQLYWTMPLEPNYGMSIISPRPWNDLLYVGAIINKSLLLKVAADAGSARIVWEGGRDVGLGPVMSAPYLEDGYMYGVDGQGELRCVELESGEHLWSTYEATTGDRRAGSATAFLVKHQDRFFLFNEKGELIIARLSPKGYEEISRAKILEPTSTAQGRTVVWSHPAFANRCMYARNDKEIVCVSLAAE